MTLTATSVADPSKSASVVLTVDPATARACAARGAEATLSGTYALLLRGGGSGGGPFTLAGSFVADGAGGVVSGSLDVNHVRTGADAGLVVVGAASSYSYGADGLGCLSLVTPTVGPQFRIALGAVDGGVATRGRIIEFDDPNGMGQRAEGSCSDRTRQRSPPRPCTAATSSA